MVKNLFTFFIFFALIYIGIGQFRSLNDYEKWSVTKTALYSLACAILAVLIIVALVLLF